jgi:hypothetical protein
MSQRGCSFKDKAIDRLSSSSGPLFDAGRTDDLPSFLLIPDIDDHALMFGKQLAHALFRLVFALKDLGRERSLVFSPPFNLESHDALLAVATTAPWNRREFRATSAQSC